VSEISEAIQRLRDHVLQPKEHHKVQYHLGDHGSLEQDIAMVVAQAERCLPLALGFGQQADELARLRGLLARVAASLVLASSGPDGVTLFVEREVYEAAKATGAKA
jgi:hypothetical protein